MKLAGSEIVVCLPTYNEIENLEHICTAIHEVMPRAGILVIDDNSPDGTGDRADALAENAPHLAVLHRPAKEGLGQAYLQGFREILENTDAAILVQMDADGSHPPKSLPGLLALHQDADLVIGSRYVPGGSIRNWSWHRRVLSRFGSLYARSLLRLPIQDLTGGFKVWSRETLAAVIAEPIQAQGYVFQILTTWRAACTGARILEGPICFEDRGAGTSKMSLPIALEAAWRVPLLALWGR